VQAIASAIILNCIVLGLEIDLAQQPGSFQHIPACIKVLEIMWRQDQGSSIFNAVVD